MDKIRISKQFFFEAAHALYGYDGKCKNIHGHSYILTVSVKGEPIHDPTHEKNGMVMDFGDLKAIVKNEIVDVFDHATLFNKNTPHKSIAEYLRDNKHKVMLLDYQPTSEMLLVDFARRIKAKLPDSVQLQALKLYETGTSYAEWFATDNEN